MARYRVEVQGDGQKISHLGSIHSGIWSHTRGWDVGIEVVGDRSTRTNNHQNDDKFYVYLTGGSNNSNKKKLIGKFTKYDLEGE
jgi:hypothetical protein